MDSVLVKIKGLRKKPYFKLISSESLFEPVTINNNACVSYSPDHNLDEDSWFRIEEFSEQEYCLDILKKDIDTKDYYDLEKSKFSKISNILSVQGGDVYFQKVTPSLFIRRKTLVFGEIAAIEKSDNRIIINDHPDAIYIRATDILLFRNLATISSMFTGIDELYKEATSEEVSSFLAESFIELNLDYGVDKVSKPNRKRVALAMAALEAMSDDDKKDMLSYVDSYCQKKLSFNEKTSKFKISNDDDLKLLLYGVEQRFYTTPFGQEKRLANSVQRI